MPGLVLIHDEILAADLAVWDISSISQDYEHLEIHVSGRCDLAATALDLLAMRFNNDSSANYDTQYSQLAGGSNSVNSSSNQNQFGQSGISTLCFFPGATAPTGAHAECRISIQDYTNTTFRKGFTAQGFGKYGESGGQWPVVVSGGEWQNTAAINRIQLFFVGGGEFIAGSRLTIYALPVAADQKISDLTEATSLADSDEFVIASSGTSKRITATTLQGILHDETLGSATASFDVTSISQNYKHLKLILQLRGTTSAEFCVPRLRLNNDTGNNYKYSFGYIPSDGSGQLYVAENGPGSFIRIGLCSAASADAGSAGSYEIIIPNYAATVFWKQVKFQGEVSNISDLAYAFEGGGSWQSTAAINRVTISPDANNWLTGSHLTIYGMS